jgi:hypothetical protein
LCRAQELGRWETSRYDLRECEEEEEREREKKRERKRKRKKENRQTERDIYREREKENVGPLRCLSFLLRSPSWLDSPPYVCMYVCM